VKLETKNLGELCEFQGGSQPPKSNFIYEPKEGYIRFLQIRDFGSEKNHTYIPISKKNKTCNADDIMVGRYGASVGKILRGKSGAYNVALMKATPVADLINKEYFWYYLNSSSFQDSLRNVASRSAQDGFSKDDIFNFQVPLPPLPIQLKLVSKLNAIFSEIDKAITATEINVKNSESLFQSYLTIVFEQGDKNWREVKLSEISEYFNGLTYSPKDVNEKGIVVLRSSNIQNDKLVFDDIVRVNLKVKEKIVVRDGDILMCSRNGSQRLVGKTATIKNLDESMTFGTFMMIVRGEFNPFLEWFFKSNSFKRQIAGGENTMINQITRYMLDDVVLHIPPADEMNSIIEVLSNLFRESRNLQSIYGNKLLELNMMKRSILEKALRGELVLG
jgi:type I restriction enzyme S subunit